MPAALQPEQTKALISTFEYIKHLVQMGQEPVYSLSEYRNVRILEQELQAKPGIKHFPNSDEPDPAWLEITRLHPDKAPPLPEVVQEWVNQSHNPTKEPTLKESVMITVPRDEVDEMIQNGTAKQENVLATPDKPGMFDVRVFAKDDPKLDEAFNKYLHNKWLPWSLKERPRRETIRIYDQLFSVFQIMTAGEAERPIELVWGIGHALWKPSEFAKKISHPLLEVLVELELDSTSQALRIRPRSTLPRIYTAPFEALQLPGVSSLKEDFEKLLQELEKEERTINPWDPTSFAGILRSAVAQLAKDARYIPDHIDDITDRAIPRANESLAITDTWAIYARTRGLNYLVQDLERFQKKTTTDTKVKDCAVIKFATEPSSEQPAISFWGLGRGEAEVTAGGFVGSVTDDQDDDNPIYFPKPFNDAQRGIVERLEKADGVVVQGPPGTGKTHTIANIICHYLAMGRSVLVTAKSETALDVLKGQIPKEIQPLVISMVSNDREGMQQQKQAIETLQGEVVRLQGREGQILNEIRLGEKEVSQLQSAINKIDKRVELIAKQQLEPVAFEWLDEDFENTAKLAEWVVQYRGRFEWFPDDLGPGDEYTPQFSDDDIARLIAAKQKVGQEINHLNLSVPTINNLPSTEDIANMHRELVMAKNLESDALRDNVPRFKEGRTGTIRTAEGLLKDITSVLEWVRQNDAEWIQLLLQARVYTDKAAPLWLELVDELRPELTEIIAEHKEFIRKPVDYKINDTKERELLRMSAERGRNGKSPLSLMQRLDRRAREVVESVTVLGRRPQSTDDWEHIAEYLSFEGKCDELVVRWNAVASSAPLPEVPADNALQAFEGLVRQMEEVESYATKFVNTVWSGLDEVFAAPDFHRLEPKAKSLESAVNAVEQNLAMSRLFVSEHMKAYASEALEKYNCPEATALLKILAEVGSADYDVEELKEAWQSQMKRLRHLQELQNDFLTIREVTDKIRNSGASIWADQLAQTVHTTEENENLIEWREVWRWVRLNTLLHMQDVQGELMDLEKERQEKEDRLKQVFENVVKLRTYLMLCSKMSDRAKSALAKFSVAIMQIGRGTGVRAPVFMRIAQRAMDECAEAIPCWIMPSWRVSEVLPAQYGFFDLVIVDEASQCDIRDLPAVARGKKVLIVGDDRQVSPTPPFIENKKLFQLKHNYLKDHPFGDLMIPGISLYDLAGAVFPGSKIILNEHFRCVEPIIRFSFGFYPDVAIHPLRIPKATERIDPPLVDILVENGGKVRNVNFQEADVIVNEIEQLVADKRYESRSIGVISLIGRKQAALIQSRLLERIGQEKFIKHRIICGDSASFQGRERDIVFLSMVASPGQSRALTMRPNEQRFNVAVSRARDRLYLVRSVTLEQLPNPRDLKVKLIHHFKDPMPVRADVDRELVELCESGFERDVFLWLTRKGYSVMPQVSVGEYRIDLVVEGDNDRRLAIELDGDRYHGPEKWLEDWIRQKILERAGWRFWRCWASSYIADPEGCMNSLTQTIEKMGIQPSGQKAKKYAYTEHRRISVDLETKEIQLESEESDVVEVGDRVVLALEDSKEGYITVLITRDRSEPENLVFKPDHPIAETLLDKIIGDEVEINIFGKHQKVSVVQIAKGGLTGDGAGQKDDLTDGERQRAGKSNAGDALDNEERALNDKTGQRLGTQQDFPQLRSPAPSLSGKPSTGFSPAESYPDPRTADRGEVAEYLKNIVAEHGPIVVEHLYHIYRERVGVKKLGRQIKQGLNRGMKVLLNSGEVQLVDKPPTKTRLDMSMVAKTPDQNDVEIRVDFERPIEWIPLNELQSVAQKIKATRPGLDEEELMRAILKRYGLKRITRKTKDILLNALAGI